MVKFTVLRPNISTPVSKNLKWSSHSSDPADCESVIMEEVEGVQLFKVSSDADETRWLGVIDRLTKVGNQLTSIAFHAFGSLSLRESIARKAMRNLLDLSTDPSNPH